MDLLLKQPVVIDNGTGVIRAGFAGEDHASVLLRNVVGRPKHQRVMAGGALDGDL
jgi:centractin